MKEDVRKDYSFEGTLYMARQDLSERFLPESIFKDFPPRTFGVEYMLLRNGSFYDGTVAYIAMTDIFFAVAEIMRKELRCPSSADRRYRSKDRDIMLYLINEFIGRVLDAREATARLPRNIIDEAAAKADVGNRISEWANDMIHICNNGLMELYSRVGRHVLESHHPFERFRQMFIGVCSVGHLKATPEIVAGPGHARYRQEMPSPTEVFTSIYSIERRINQALAFAFTTAIECCTSAVSLGWYPDTPVNENPKWYEYINDIKLAARDSIIQSASSRIHMAELLLRLKSAKEASLDRWGAVLEDVLF